MLWHIRPRLFSPFKYVTLIDLRIDPLGVHLRGGVDLATRRPYPNKEYAVACRKKGHKATDGILLETATSVDELHSTARWAIEAEFAVTHHVHYKLLDRDWDAASDDMVFWSPCGVAGVAELGGWSNRRPAWAEDHILPIHAEPKMEVIPRGCVCLATEDVLDYEQGWKGWITERTQTFAMPTIERERLLNTDFNRRMPTLDAAFCVQ
jgi:hypothetical protein